MPTFVAAVLAFSGLALLPEVANAQPTKLALSRVNTDTLPVVKVDLSYIAPDGSVVDGRAAADFRISVDALEQGAATVLTQFDKTSEPVALVTITQVSGALGPVLTEVKAGFRRLSQTVSTNPASRVSVLAYASTTKRLVEAGSAAAIESALGKLSGETAGAQVHLLDALQTAIDLLKTQPAGLRKLIVVVSDGSDINPDVRGFSDLGNRAQEAGIVIDTIGYGELEPAKLRHLQELSRRCAGSARAAKSAAELSAQLSAVGEEIKKQYVATFRIGLTGDGQEHSFQVVADAAGKPVFSNMFNVKLPAGKPTAGAAKPLPAPLTKPLLLPPPT